jgi:hypothetical protein
MNKSFFTIVLILGIVVGGLYIYDKQNSTQDQEVTNAVTAVSSFEVLPGLERDPQNPKKIKSWIDYDKITQYNPNHEAFVFDTVKPDEVSVELQKLIRETDTQQPSR